MLGQRVCLEANAAACKESRAGVRATAAARASASIGIVEVEAERDVLRVGLAGGSSGCAALEEVGKGCVPALLFAFAALLALAFVLGLSFALGLTFLLVCC